MGFWYRLLELEVSSGKKKSIVKESRLESAFHNTKNSLPNLFAWELWPRCGASLFNACFLVSMV